MAIDCNFLSFPLEHNMQGPESQHTQGKQNRAIIKQLGVLSSRHISHPRLFRENFYHPSQVFSMECCTSP